MSVYRQLPLINLISTLCCTLYQLNMADVFNDKKISIPREGVLSGPILAPGDCTNHINYKLVVDKDPIHETFRPIIKGGKIGPAFDASISIVQSVDDSSSASAVDLSTAAVSTIYSFYFMSKRHTGTISYCHPFFFLSDHRLRKGATSARLAPLFAALRVLYCPV